MHIYKIDQWKHPDRFNIVNRIGERNTIIVIAFTAVTMVVEIVAGLAYGSMALLAYGYPCHRTRHHRHGIPIRKNPYCVDEPCLDFKEEKNS